MSERFETSGAEEMENTDVIQDPLGDVAEETIEKELAANPEILERIVAAQKESENS